MTHVEDDYAALHAYLQLAEIEIDEVISGRLAHKRVSDTEIRPLYATVNPRTGNTSLLKNTEISGEGAATKPPRGFRRDNRASNRKTEGSERRQGAAVLVLGPAGKELDQSTNCWGVEDAGTGGLGVGDRAGCLVDDELHIGADDDLCVLDEVDDRDVLLERILNKEGKRELHGIDTSQRNDRSRSLDSSVNYAVPVSTRTNQPPTDLHKLLVTDRYSLLLGSGLHFLNIDDVVMTNSVDLNPTLIKNPPHAHRCSDARQHHTHHQCHHQHTDLGETDPPLQRNKKLAASFSSLPSCPKYKEPTRCWTSNQLTSGNQLTRQLSLPSWAREQEPTDCWIDNGNLQQPLLPRWTKEQEHTGCWVDSQLTNQPSLSFSHPRGHHASSLVRAGSEKDVLYELRQKRRAELLTMIYKDVNRVQQSLIPEQPPYHRPLKLIPSPTSPAPPSHLSLHPDVLSPDITNCSLDINEQDGELDLSSSDRSGTDCELKDLFNPPPKKFTSSKQSRKSYPNDDNLIISPPPAFNSPKREQEMWVKVRFVTRSHDDLSSRPDQKALATDTDGSTDSSPVQYYAVPFEFEATPESKYRVPQTADDLYLRDHSPIDDDLHNQDVLEYISRISKGTTSLASNSKSSQNESVQSSVPRIRSLERSFREESNDKDHRYQDGQCRQGHDKRALEAEDSVAFITTNGCVRPLTLTAIDSDVKKKSTLGPTKVNWSNLVPTNVEWSTSRSDSHGLSSAEMTSPHSKSANEKRRLNGPNRSGISSGNPTRSAGSTSKRGQTESVELKTIKPKEDLQLMFDFDDDNNNNSTSSNLFSMCLARDCKHLASCRSKKVPESPPQTHSRNQSDEGNHELSAKQQSFGRGQSSLASDCSNTNPSHYPDSIRGDDCSGIKSNISSELNSNIGRSVVSSSSSSSSSPSSFTENRMKFAHVEVSHLNHLRPVPRCREDLSLPDSCCKHVMERTIMKDTAVQTSLEVDASIVDISDTVANQVQAAGSGCEKKYANKEEENNLTNLSVENKEIYEVVSQVRIKKEEPDKINNDLKIKENNNNKSNDTMNSKSEKIVVDLRRSKVRKPPKTSFHRSKSIHGSELDSDEAREGRRVRPTSPKLSCSLRELSHLNIDVSQRLVDGEQRYVVDNGSADMQVVVNALTPVLSRRNRARNARRLQNASPVKDTKGTDTGTANGTEIALSPVDQQNIEDDSAKELQQLYSCLQILENVEDNGEGETLPLYTRLKSHEGSCSERRSVDPNSPKQIVSKHLNSSPGRVSICRGNDMLNKKLELTQTVSNPISSSTKEKKQTGISAFNTNTGFELDLSDGHNDLERELDESRKCLFLSPKHAHTWHGASSSSTHRSAPRIGVDRVFGDEAKLVCGPEGGIQPVPDTLALEYDQNSYTLPVISRTLLDALHKRYCAHQYSGHYQTHQPFSLLKLDSTFSSGNQSVTALLVEPRRAVDHEVHAAPPSPEVIARLRMLTTAFQSQKDREGVHPVLQTADKEQTVNSTSSQQTSEDLTALQPAAIQRQDQLDLPRTSPDETSQDTSLSVTPNSSPNLSDKLNHSSKHQGELEAIEALKWLRAAGFPQYAQMFDDGQFPVDIGIVERDHDFLDKDSLQSLFRRLDTLNKYAGIRLDALPSKKATSEEDDEDDFCALSERWEYQKSVRRWSRKDLTPSQKAAAAERSHRELAVRSGSHDSLLADQDSGSQTGDSPLLDSKMPHQTVVQHQERVEMASLSHGGHAVADISPEDQKGSPISPRLRRATSDKMKTAKSLFKKMDGLKSTKSRRHQNSRNIVEISGPVLADRENMQVKLDRLNCVDISQPTETLPSPPLGHTKPPPFVSRGSSSGADSHPTSPDKPHSPPVASSPRPHSDFMLRPKDVPYTSHPSSTSQSRSSHASPTQTSSSSNDSSFDDYYHAKTTFLQNLQSSKGHTPEGVRKNNSDTNLVEIFLVPQDHQPGRFPRMLQNGYIETEACGTAVNVRTGSVRLGRGTGLTSDNRSPNSRFAQSFSAQGRGQRISVYDNFLPADGKRLEGNETRSPIPGVVQLESSTDNSSFSRGGVEINTPGLLPELKSSHQLDSVNGSRDSSVAQTTDSLSDQEHTSSSHERSVSYESSSSSSQTLRESSLSNEGVITGDESTNSRKSSPDSISPKSRGVTHSSSVDSYFRDSSSQGEASNDDASEKPSSSTFQQDYDEFDRILQELYQNINDLTSFMDRDKNEKAPKLIRAATSPLPAGNKKSLSPLHVATPSSTRPLLKPQSAVDSSSPSIATSDLVPSPASPGSPLDTSESLSFYRGLDLDNDNSSSGGEGNTAESGSEDQEAVLTDVSHDDSLDQIIEVSRERRDSGVGHSLTRASSDRRHKKIRWHSFQKSHRPDINSRAMQINSLTVGQLVRLQKLSLLRLTGIMEKCLPVNKSGWNWMVPRFMKRHKSPDFSDKNVFGVPLSVMAQRTGQPIPQCILYAMRYLRCTCQSAVGIFRKSGVKSKIQHLRDHLEAHPDTTNFDGENTYNVADMLKTYFRDLPECLLTNKMSETFRSIYTYVPQSQRLEAIQAAILLLPDENREVLQSILLFLSDISDHETDHQMNASNLAVCFTPTVFHLGPRQSVPYSPKRNRKNSSGVPDPREILEQKAAHECLLMMITDCKKLFTVPHNIFRQLQVQSLAHMEPTLPQDIGNSPSDIRAFGQERIQMVLKESHDKNRGWIPTLTIGDVEVFHRKPMDDCPLKEWKLIVDIEAPPIEVLRRIMHERHTWDEDLLSWSVVERLDPYSDIFQFVLNSMAPHPPRNFCVLRYWRSDLNKGACSLITMSVEHSDALEIHGVWAIDLGTYFLMEPCGSGRSRLTYITRMDTRGRMPEWYTKIFGHISANFLERLKESFKQDSSGPETKV